MNLELVALYNIIIVAAMGLYTWDKKQDKLKLKDHYSKFSKLKIDVVRQDERHKALAKDVKEIKGDTKDIKKILMNRHI